MSSPAASVVLVRGVGAFGASGAVFATSAVGGVGHGIAGRPRVAGAALVVLRDHARDAAHRVRQQLHRALGRGRRRQVHEAHALRVAADDADALHGHADHLSLLGDDHQLVAVDDLLHRDDVAVSLRGLDGDDALAAAVRHAVLGDLAPLAVAVLGHGEQRGLALHADHAHHLVLL